MENIFDSDSFSEKNMPLITVVGKLLDQVYFPQMSKEMRECVIENSAVSDEFYNSLNESQREMFEKLELAPNKVSQIDIILECKNIEQACSGIGFYNSLIIQHQI